MSQETKTCKRCRIEKPISAFSLDGTRRKPNCRKCLAEIWRLRYQGQKEEKKEREENRNFTTMMARWPAPGISE